MHIEKPLDSFSIKTVNRFYIIMYTDEVEMEVSVGQLLKLPWYCVRH